MTCVLVTALCNQPEAFVSDLGDDQSRYLCTGEHFILRSKVGAVIR